MSLCDLRKHFCSLVVRAAYLASFRIAPKKLACSPFSRNPTKTFCIRADRHASAEFEVAALNENSVCVLRKGVPCHGLILEKYMEGLQLPENAQLVLVDLMPNRL